MRLLAACALLATACSPQFDPCLPLPGVIQDFRVLGVSADPPEAEADLGSGVVESISLRVLVADPAGSTILPVGFTACAADLNGDCAATSVLRAIAPYDFTKAVAVVVPAALIAAAVAADPLHGFGGPHVRLDVTVAPPVRRPSWPTRPWCSACPARRTRRTTASRSSACACGGQ